MKLLLLIPLIFSWNFIFWGTVGLLRYLGEVTSNHTSVLAPLGLAACALWLMNTAHGTGSAGLTVAAFSSVVMVSLLLWYYHRRKDEFARSFVKDSSVGDSSSSSTDKFNDTKHILSASEEFSYTRLAQLGAEHARKILLQKHSSLVTEAISRHAHRNLPRNDLQYLATVGLSQSVRDYDISGDQRFTQFAQEKIEQSILSVFPHEVPYKKRKYINTITEGSNRQRFQTPKPISDHSNTFYLLCAASIVALVAAVLWNNGINSFTTIDNMGLQTTLLLVLAIVVPTLLMTALSRWKTKTQPLGYTGPRTGVNSSYSGVISRKHVAVLIPAYNEGAGVEPTVRSAINLVGAENVFVVNDCSSDNTSQIVKSLSVNQLDLQTNVGKARALDSAIKTFQLCENFEFLLILDADTEIDCDYLKYALPKFDDPEVSVVAGHAIPKWDTFSAFSRSSFYVAYRIKLYMLTQAFLRYGQTSSTLNVSFIIPGFSSIYRTRVIPHIDITAPGLVIEDFNMTFELHKKQLGRIAYSPRAVAFCHEPHSMKDYTSQIKRWHLGFWQTVIRHGFWPSRFSLALALFVLESIIISTAFVTLPLVGLYTALSLNFTDFGLPLIPAVSGKLFLTGLIFLLALDMASTAVIAWITKIPALLWHGPLFFVLRWVDSVYFILTLPLAFFVKSSGRWTSPSRSVAL